MLPETAFSDYNSYLSYLRDWFAGQAIPSGWDAAMQFSPSGVNPEDFTAEQAYRIADAMLAEREKGERG